MEKEKKINFITQQETTPMYFFFHFALMTITSNQMHIVLHNKKQQNRFKRINIVLESETFLLQINK